MLVEVRCLDTSLTSTLPIGLRNSELTSTPGVVAGNTRTMASASDVMGVTLVVVGESTATALHCFGHGDSLAATAHAVTAGFALAKGVIPTPELVPAAVTTIGVSASTLVEAVALSLHPGVELMAAVTLLASVESLTPGAAVA